MRKLTYAILLILALAANTLGILPMALRTAAAATTAIYTDSLAPGWQNWSWGSSVNLQDAAYKRTGSYSASVAYTRGWGGLYFGHNGFNTAGYDSLEFYVNGGANSGQRVTINLVDAAGNFLPSVNLNQYVEGGSIAANTWRRVSVPLSVLQGSDTTITGVVLMDASGGVQPAFYIDDVSLTDGQPALTPTPTTPGSPTTLSTRTATAAPSSPTPLPTSTPAGGLPPVPAGVPPYFSLGLFNGNSSDIPSGVSWNFRYQYLAGGANTGDGWATWNADGTYASNYINESRNRGMTTGFIYYQILQSAPNYDEYANLQNAGTMRAYYDDFKLLMQRSAQAAGGQRVFINIEPDLTGVMQQHSSNSNDDASRQPTSVASSGHPDVQGIPNTFQGFYQALAHIRDLYAPNSVSLGLDISTWGASDDITLVRDPAYNWQRHADRTATYLNSLGPGFQLLFFSPSDRDSAWYQSQGSNRWWDDTNQALPNFNRMAEWMGRIIQTTQKRALMWQVPNGNRVYRTENNTDGHWQDNRPEYFLNPTSGRSHMQQWANYGFVGMMFGAGVGSQSHYFDHHGDGITNPPAINGNNAVSSYADDDGGYIRLQSGAYISGGTLPLPGGGGPQPTATATHTATSVPVPPTNTPVATTTTVPATATSVPPTATSTPTWVPATSTAIPPTATSVPSTATSVPPTATTVPPAPTATTVPAYTALVYGDALGAGWQNWSWGSSVNLQDAAYKRTGSYSASVAYTRGWGGLYFGHNGFNTAGYDSLEFYVNGGANSGQRVTINLVDAAGNFLPSVNLNQYVEGGSIAANTWRRVSVPLSVLQGSDTTITGVVLMDASGDTQPRYYLDDMVFTAR